MSNMLPTIVPKSDQLNADDLIGRSITIKITNVSIVMGDQPVALSYEGDNGKPYKPGKSMRRVLVNVWGSDANAYVGRSLTLYRDDKVSFGGMAVGGIRISHMSHIDKSVTMALTASKAIRKPFTVNPLVIIEKKEEFTDSQIAILRKAGEKEASKGVDALKAWWKGGGAIMQKAVGGVDFLDHLKAIAAFSDGASNAVQFPPVAVPLDDRVNSMVANLALDLEAIGTDDYQDVVNSSECNELLKEVEDSGDHVLLSALSGFIQ